MTVSKSKKARVNYMADFETTTDPKDCRVWHWGLANIDTAETDEDVEWDINIDSFFDRVMQENCNVYFHNLKFDAGFIFYWLLTHGYNHTDERKMYPGEFKVLMSDLGMLYSVTVRWENGKTLELRDSYKKLPNKLERIAKAFNLDVVKGEIDYHKERPVGYIPDENEQSYLCNDVLIAAKALRQVFAEGMKKLTVASDSLAEFKRLTNPKLLERFFPVLSQGIDKEIRRAYRGGFTYADPRYSKRVTGGGHVYDVNSLYPYVMRHRLLPYGEPVWMQGKPRVSEKYPLAVFSVTFTAKLKKNHIPCIQIKSSSIFSSTEYLTEIKEPTTLMVSNIDWDLYNDHYDIEVDEWGGSWMFQGTNGIFDIYIDKWMNVKANSEGARREIAKLHLNSLYGKLASSTQVSTKYPVLEDGVVKYKRGEDDERPPVYTPAGVFITAYAREITIRAAQENYDTFAYADTDSLHLITDTPPTNLNIHKSDLGAWKHEYRFTSAFYVRAKAYLEKKESGEYEAHFAGVPENVANALTFDDMKPGTVLDGEWLSERLGKEGVEGKKVPKSVPGGIVLVEVPFELKF